MTRFFTAIIHCLFVLLTASSVLFAQDGKEYPAPGKLFDAGGHLLHMNIQGKGTPTVIFENGSGDFSFIWGLVQPEVAKFTSSVSYDRAGYAWSEAGPEPRSSRQIAFELHTALHNAGIKGPYILVGQSFGGFLVRAFARFYPKETVGMVLVDVLNENQKIVINDTPTLIRGMAKGQQAPAPKTFDQRNRPAMISKPNEPIIPDSSIEYPLDKLPKEMQHWQIWGQNSPVYRREATNEMIWSPEDVSDLYKHRREPNYKLGNIPLIVLTKGNGGYGSRSDSASLETERLRLQEELAGLSTNSKHIIDKNSGHNIHLEDPNLVINSIREVYEAVRQHKSIIK